MSWSFDPGVVIPLALTAFLYVRGAHRHSAYFWAGWTVLALALISPIHEMGEELFSAHMVQHEILMLVAAPLLVLSRPLAPLLRGLPVAWRRPAGRISKAITVSAFTAWWIHGAAIWIWHAPFLFQATLRSQWMHAAQHASFFFSALLFWWGILETSAGAGVLYVFTTAVHTSILGALLTFAPHPVYPAYGATVGQWGLTLLEDQQLGGLIMWVPAGLVYLGAGLLLFARWLRQSDAMPSRAATLLCLATLAVLCGCARPQDPGKEAIVHYGCGACHTIAGITSAHGRVGPPLTGIGQRTYVAGMLRNTPDNLEYWVRHPREVNPKTAMPEMGVTEHDASDIARYLYTIK